VVNALDQLMGYLLVKATCPLVVMLTGELFDALRPVPLPWFLFSSLTPVKSPRKTHYLFALLFVMSK